MVFFKFHFELLRRTTIYNFKNILRKQTVAIRLAQFLMEHFERKCILYTLRYNCNYNLKKITPQRST